MWWSVVVWWSVVEWQVEGVKANRMNGVKIALVDKCWLVKLYGKLNSFVLHCLNN